LFFFFSSRRRHTRSKRDWSSDVCSSDLSDENFAFQLYARNKQMEDLPFYGLGPDTNVHNAVHFSERDTRAGALFASPLTSWLSTDRKSTRLNSSHVSISYAVFCLKKKKS